ncbi:MAG: hypothetical protein K2O65_05625 [Lachnospiraceae bacterium]|nr:hypothetical protein [Lachnospiraceae bacterium]
MGRALGKMKQTLSVLLAVAMIVTALPQTTAVAYATEAQNVLDESSGAAESSGENTGKDNAGNGSVNTGKENGSEETDTPDENSSEEANAPSENESDKTHAPDGNGWENTESPDGNGSGDIEDPVESDSEEAEKATGSPVGISDNNVSDNDVPDSSVSDNDVPDGSVSDNDVSGEENDEPATVRILIPTYPYTSYSSKSFIKELQYKVGESEEWTIYKVRSTIRPDRDDYIDITVDAGSTLQFRIVPFDHTVINEVSYSLGGVDSIILEAENDIYKIENIRSQTWTPAYRINISADFVYTLHFVDVYADSHDGQKSVKLYQYTTGNADSDTGDDTGDTGVTYKDVIGETVELSGADIDKYLSDHYYKVEPESGYTFHGIDSNATGLRIRNENDGYYSFEKRGYDLGVQEITIFVLAEPTESHQLKFNIPSGIKNKLVMTVTGTDPAGHSEALVLNNDSVEVKNDLAVTVDAWLEDDLSHTLRATCKVEGEDAAELPYDSREKMNNLDDVPYAWRNTYRLGNMLKDGDVTIDFAQVNMHSVAFHFQECASQIRAIYIMEPISKSYWYDWGDYENLTVDVAEGEKLKFNVREDWLEGTLHISTAEDGSGELTLGYDEECEEDVYTVSPTGPTDLYFRVTGYEYRFNYSESDFSVLVYNYDSYDGVDDTAEPLQLSEDHIYTSDSSRMQFRIMVKPNNDNWKHVSVSYVYDWEERWGERNPEYDDTENGYLCYLTEAYVYGNSEIKIEGYNTNTVTFVKNDNSLYFQRRTKADWDDDYYYWTDIDATYDQLSAGIEVKEGEEVCFRVRGYDSDIYNLKVNFASTGNDTLRTALNDEGKVSYYYFTPTADATITAEITERKQHTVTIEKADSITDFRVWGGTREEGESGLTGKYLVRDGDTIEIRGISNRESSGLLPGYRGKVLCTADGKTSEVQMKYSYNGLPYFELEVTSDMTLNVDAVQTSECTITFADQDKLAEVRVWEAGKSAEKDNLYDAQTHSAVLNDDKEYYFDFMLTDGNAPESVVMKDAAGDERQLWLDEDEVKIYWLGVPQSDAQITVNTVPGYTILFSAEKDSDLEYWVEFDEWGVDITNEKIQVAATDSFPFSWSGSEDEYELSLDSDAFAIKKVWMTYADDEDEGWYQYSIVPVQTNQLPATVTVVAKAYPKHTITMDYTAQVKQIYLENASGDRLWNRGGDKEVQVQGPGTILGARTINGYIPEVKLQGSGEARILTPFRVNDSEVYEYYIGELTEDVTISVTAVRSTQKQTYYEVGFLSKGNKVRIADAVAGTQYSVAGDDDAYWNYVDKYTVLKGSSISFTVEASDGYEVDGVYANDEAVKPVQGVYMVTPVKDTQIRVDVSRIEQKYPVTFIYPDTVAGVKVKDLALQNNMLQVKEGTQISFAVELADQNHSVTSVKMNGKEIPFDQTDGCYTMISIAAAMKVEITTAEADKRVTFTKNVEHMDYSVETDEMVKESETAGTYVVAALAGILRFTVTSSKKESVPAVTYISATEGKVTLQAKSKQENESGISYTYEIAVSELPLKSEVEIGETNVAGEEDKIRLEEKIKSYQGYSQTDYTAESWEVFAQALADAQACLDKADATKAEIDAAIATLDKAAAGLKKAEENPNPPTPVIKEGLWIEEIPAQTYTGTAFKPEVKVYNGEELLTNKKDYTISYKNNTNAGTATVTVNGKGNYKAKDTATFSILKKNLNDADIMVADVYAIVKANGTVANPKVTVKYGKKTLKNGTDYTVQYPTIPTGTDGKAVPGTYEITINAKKTNGDAALNYTGSRTIKYEVRSSDTVLMSKAKITLSSNKVAYHGNETEIPKVTVKIGSDELSEEDDYEVSVDNWNQCGKATITVTGKAGTKYYGSKSVTYTVEGTKLSVDISGIKTEGYTYTGRPVYVSRNAQDGSEGDMKVTMKGGTKRLEEGTDYIVSYKAGKKEGEHTNVGKVTVTITGINAYTGSVNTTFKITAFDLENYSKTGSALQFNPEGGEKAKYTKNGAKPVYTLTFNDGENERELVEKTDFTVSYSGNTKIKAGEKSATMTIKGKGNFKGKITYQYEVTGASVDDVEAVAADIVMPTQFKKLKTTVKVLEKSTGKALKAGTDYVKAVKYYKDAECTTEITEGNFSSLQLNDRIYAKVVLNGNYAGDLTAAFRLYESTKKIADATVKVEPGNVACDNKGNPIYTGNAIRPKVTVTPKGSNTPLDEGTDYVVTYSNNINKGKATATVTGIGEYGGTKSVKFTIVAADMAWAKQSVKAVNRVLEIFSDSMLIPE